MKVTANRITKVLLTLTATSIIWGCMDSAETETNPETIDPSLPVSDWQLVWSDEFDGSSIDPTKWNHEVNCNGGGNNEQQCYTDSAANSFVQDGMLNIVALPAEEGAEKPYTSARLNTKGKGDFTYGRFEMRAKLPSGQGSWPAFWMLPTDNTYGGWPKSGEIDIVEAVNLKAVGADGVAENRVFGTLHYGQEWPDNESSGKEYTLPDGVNPADDFHTYAIEWQEGEIRWYVDNYLFATQRQSEVRYNSKDEAVGLAHKGWYAEYYNAGTGELETHWGSAPFDQDFHLLLNFAVGGDWPENVNATGVDADAFTNGQSYVIDYVRVYECSINPETGEGCATVRGGYDSEEDGLVEGTAPVPVPPSTGIAQNLTIFDGTSNPNWPAWDCCGGSAPAVVADADKGDVTEFTIGASPTVMGFISREAFITDDNGQATPFDASPLLEDGTISFEMKVETMPNDASATWLFKVESNEGSTAVELPLTDSSEGTAPVAGQWQTYTFSLASLEAAGLDLSAIDVIMIFPAWGAGDGAVYRVTNAKISSPTVGAAPSLTVFEDEVNPSWPAWDCCGGSTPLVEIDDDEHGNVTEFSIGASPTVMGFISRSEFITADGASPEPFDASAILSNGVIQFDMKVTSAPNDASAAWLFKVESNAGDTAVELPLTDSGEGVSPVVDQWMTYTFNLSDLADGGLDVSAIDVLMVFPAWGAGEGATYRLDNVKIYDPNASADFNGHVLFADEAKEGWAIWDCCGGSTPTVENDDTAHGMTAEFVIGAAPTVMGILADDGVLLDASSLLANGVVQFELKVVNAPNDASSTWLFKIESDGASTAVELPLTDSQEGVAPTVGEWQTYTYSLQDLFDAGLDISAIDVLMVFPAWGTGDGAVYRLDNVMITAP
ncbi:MAG: family 16 glycosylhydrolase [Gammaproteobacteria bacterium]|nr:family 16 glycosylhydrolase [Gammaproteobacteria bacterium]